MYIYIYIYVYIYIYMHIKYMLINIPYISPNFVWSYTHCKRFIKIDGGHSGW